MNQSNPKNPWKTVSQKVKHNTPWIKVISNKVITPSGTEGTYGTVHFKKLAIGIIPLDEFNNTWIVGQWRFPINEYSWEIPEGGSEPGESALDTAKKELLEETGIVAKKWKLILEMDLSNSATDEKAYIFVAKDLEFKKSNPDPDEDLIVQKIPFEKLFLQVMNGIHKDSLTVSGVLKLKFLMDQNKI